MIVIENKFGEETERSRSYFMASGLSLLGLNGSPTLRLGMT